MQRRQCVALCFIFLLAGAEAARTVESANVMNSLVLHSGRASEGFEDEMAHEVAVGSSSLIPSTKSLMRHLESLNSSTQDVLDGNVFFRVKYCMLTCPVMWVKIIYHSWLAKSGAQKIVSESFGTRGKIDRLPTVSRPLADTFRGTMRKTVFTFLKVIDNSLVQRVLLSLFFAPLGLFRVLTKMSPLGLCFLKQAWKDLEAEEGYQQKRTSWWKFFLMGCPDAPAESPAFTDENSTEELLGSMVYAISKPSGLAMEEQAVKWRKASSHVQCVRKQSRNGEWSKRRIVIEKGVITWTADSRCHDVDLLDRVGEWFGHEKVFSMEFLTKPPDADTVQLFNKSECMAFQNPYRQFMMCAEPGYTMDKAKEVMDEHLAILGGEHKLLQMAAKVERLVAASGLKGDDRDEKDVQELAGSMDASGDSNVQGLAEEIGRIPDGEVAEVRSVKEIMEKVKQGSSLLASGDAHAGGALLQEAYAAAHGHEELSQVMHGKVGSSGAVQDPATGGAASGGSISTTELLIILAICGFGALCIGVGLMFAASNLEEDSQMQPWSNATQAVPLPHLG